MQEVSKNISQQLRQEIAKAVEGLDEGQKFDFEHVLVEHPGVEEHGDYSTNVALVLAKQLNLRPRELAERIVENLQQNASATLSKDIRIWDRVEVAGPGFVNFWINRDVLVEQLMKICREKNFYGQGKMYQGKKVIVEFTDPNPFKEFHIGHLYSNIVGESLSRLLEFQGADLWRVNYQGDVGMHVAKSLWGLLQLKDQMPVTSATPAVKVAFLGRAYALGATKFEEDKKAKEEITALNKKIYEQDPEIIELYRLGRGWSLEYFETIYARLGTKFKDYFFESEAGQVGLEFVKEGLKKGVFEESEGAIIFPGDKYGLHKRVFINSYGLPTYEAKDIGLAPTKYQRFQYDLSIIVTGNEIDEYFKVLLKALSLLRPELASKTKHLSHGMVRLPEGKMSSRTGKVITGEWLIDEAKKKVVEKISDRSLSEEESLDHVTEKVAVASIKYAFLRSSIGKDIEFDFAKSIDFEGDSGPYLQYTYARARSVLRKETGKEVPSETSSDIDMSVLRWLYRFPEVVEQAAKNFAPNLVAAYLFELAKRFNAFYAEVPIRGNKERLVLTEATSIVLKNGLNLLGIEALERM